MAPFTEIKLEEFVETFDDVVFPSALRSGLSRIDRDMIFDTRFRDPEFNTCMVHDGDLHVAGNFDVPAYDVLIRGDLVVDGVLDGWFKDDDQGGSLIVTGNVRCNTYLGCYGKAGIIGGDFHARDMIVNAFPDSLLYVGGTIRTFFFFGHDVWAEFGRDAEIEYGTGYCLPFLHVDARAEGIGPFFGEEESYRLLAIEDAADCDTWTLAQHIRQGKPIFRHGANTWLD